MKTLLIATSNPGKISMFRELLSGLDLNLKFLNDFEENIPSPIENGDTIEANALLKARYYSEKTGLPALADDAGFEIDELNSEPGIMARRWAGELSDDVSDEDWIDFYQNKIKHINKDLLNASFPFCRCLYLTDGTYFFQTDKIQFFMSKNPVRPYKKGWPTSAFRIFADGRQEMQVPEGDEVWHEQAKKEGLIKLLENL